MEESFAVTRSNRRMRLAAAGVGLLLCLAGSGAELRAQDRTCLIGTGPSMLPTLPEYCRLVIVRVPLGEVYVGEFDGDIIATRLNGSNVVHRAIERRPDGSLVTRGDNNSEPDAGATTEQNYVGVVIGFEKPGSVGELLEPAPRLLVEVH